MIMYKIVYGWPNGTTTVGYSAEPKASGRITDGAGNLVAVLNCSTIHVKKFNHLKFKKHGDKKKPNDK